MKVTCLPAGRGRLGRLLYVALKATSLTYINIPNLQ